MLRFHAIFTFISIVFARPYDEELIKFFNKCHAKAPHDAFITFAYTIVDPYRHVRFEPFPIGTFNITALVDGIESKNDRFKSQALMRVACICADIPLNSYEYIVMPMMKGSRGTDALTLCVLHDAENTVESVLDIPKGFLHSYVLRQFVVSMPRSINALPDTNGTCSDRNGHPTAFIIGQNACYTFNYATFEKYNDAIDMENKQYMGPFLGSQMPNFFKIAKLLKVKSKWDVMTESGFVSCALLKNRTRLDKEDLHHANFFGYPTDMDKIAIFSQCCSGDCYDSIKNKTLCVNGTNSKEKSTMLASYRDYCPITIDRRYTRRWTKKNDDLTHFKELDAQTPIASFDENDEFDCNAKDVVTCPVETARHFNVTTREKSCCKGYDFCNLHRAFNSIVKRCHQSYGEHQRRDGCMLFFYRFNDTWVSVAPAWFDLNKLERFPLYSTTHKSTRYNMSIAFVIKKHVDPTCPDWNDTVQRDYFMINCYPKRNCDWHFNNANNAASSFFKNLDESTIYDAIEQTPVPHCDQGSITFTSDSANLRELPVKPHVTSVIGLYCMVHLKIDYISNQNYSISIDFKPVFPKPVNCPSYPPRDTDSTCCYNASDDPEYIDPDCHYSTILEKLSDPEQVYSEEITHPSGLSYNYKDDCEQRNVGFFTASRQCNPGGLGCFHLLEVGKSTKDVMASCEGNAEELIALHPLFFEDFAEALTCLVPESHDRCQMIYRGWQQFILCCCTRARIDGHIGYCAKDSKTMFHEQSYEFKRIGDFTDSKDDL